MNPILLPRRSFLLATLALFATGSSCAGAKQDVAPPVPCFTDSEREAVRIYWNAPDRYKILPPALPTERVNITVEGSTWYWTFVRALTTLRKTDPTMANSWQAWWDKHVALEKATALKQPATEDDSDGIPEGLVAAVGSPCPPLYETVTPTQYTVTFAPEDASAPFVYEDAIDFGKRSAYYGYYRQKNGVIRPGKRVKDFTGDEKKRFDALFAKAGRTDFERRVLQAVSQYEGGFEAINTYDTGYVSVGFLQFITAVDGTGSLSTVLSDYKANDPTGFQSDFRRFGIDVTANDVLVCVDPATGTEFRGADAVKHVIDDKRLTAVFERAANGDGFRLAQVHVARSRYWPGEDVLTVAMNADSIISSTVAPPVPTLSATLPTTPPASIPAPTIRTCCIADIVRSEAGMATLMDKKVNRGNIRDFADVAQRVMREEKLTDPRELAKFERTLVTAMKYRGDFLADTSLSQPPTIPDSTKSSAKPGESNTPRKRRR